MVSIEREIDRYLTLLRTKIRERDFTQLEVQETLGWGRSYISQLLTKQKSLRFEQVLSILNVIGVEPRVFFAELYDSSPQPGASRQTSTTSKSGLPHQELQKMRALLQGLTDRLRKKSLITTMGLSDAVEAQRREPS